MLARKCHDSVTWFFFMVNLEKESEQQAVEKIMDFKKIKYYFCIHTISQNNYLKFSNLKTVS